jgi:hypothetical protein
MHETSTAVKDIAFKLMEDIDRSVIRTIELMRISGSPDGEIKAAIVAVFASQFIFQADRMDLRYDLVKLLEGSIKIHKEAKEKK